MYNNKNLFKGLFWSGLDKFGFVVLSLILELILARLLLPKDYGVIGVVLVFISLSLTISEGGFSNALIHKQNRNETDFSTVFYFNIFTALFIYSIIYLIAPSVQLFFNIDDLAQILRIVSISIIFNSCILIHKAKLSIEMDFKLQAKFSLLSVFLSGIIGVYLAYKNHGVWALVYQNLSMSIFNAIFLWLGYNWRPTNIFSFSSLKTLFSFGSKILASSLIQAIYFNAYPVLIGRSLGTRNLGLYSKSSQFTQMPASVLTTVVQRVLFPFFSTHQNDDEKIFQLNQLYTKICCLLFFPIFIMMAIVAKPLVIVLFTITWEPMTPIFLILSLAYIFYPITVNNMIMFQIKNKTGLFLKIEILTKVIGVLILLSTIGQGIISIAYGILVHQILQFIITSYILQKILNRKIYDQISIVLPFLIFSLILLLLINFILSYFTISIGYQLLLGILLSIIGYLCFYYIYCKQDILDILKIIKKVE